MTHPSFLFERRKARMQLLRKFAENARRVKRERKKEERDTQECCTHTDIKV